MIEGLYHPDQHHISILDRGLFDALAWFEFLSLRDDIDDDTKSRVQGFLTIGRWTDAIDLVFLFSTDPETSLERETSESLIEAPGRAMNHDVLAELNTAYDATKKQFSDAFDLHHIQTDASTTAKQTAFQVTKLILATIRKRQGT